MDSNTCNSSVGRSGIFLKDTAQVYCGSLDNVIFCFGNTLLCPHFGQVIMSAFNRKPLLLKAAVHGLAAAQVNIHLQ